MTTPESQYMYWVKAYETAEKALEVARDNLERISKELGNISLHDAVARIEGKTVPDVAGGDL